jgi:alpha-mannosidase
MSSTIERLRTAVSTLFDGWVPPSWSRVSGPGPEEIRPAARASAMDVGGSFPLQFTEPGAEYVMRTDVELPAVLHGMPIEGDTLLMTLISMWPIDLLLDGECLLSEDYAPVATGPALIVGPRPVRAGSNGELVARVRTPHNQIWPGQSNLNITTARIRDRWERLDLAAAQLMMAEALAESAADRKALAAADALVPAELLAVDDEVLLPALDEMAAALAVFHERAAALRVHAIAHSHIDMNWLWTGDDTRHVVLRDVESVLDMMDDHPEMTFTHSQPATYEMVRTARPDLFERIVGHVGSRRWEPATFQWTEGDTNMAAGEAMCRQLLEAVRYSRDVLGRQPTVMLAPDTFGHAGNLPQLAASAGAATYYHHRCNPGRTDGTPWPAYWWEGQDGSRLLGVTTQSYGGGLTATALVEACIANALRLGLPAAMHFYGAGDHGGGPTRRNLEVLRQIGAAPGMPTSFCSTIERYAEDVRESPSLPLARGESSTIFEGCYTTHADTKRFNRHGENLLSTADAVAALAGIEDAPDRLRAAWREVCFHQFHDILDGSAIAEAYAEQAEAYHRVIVPPGEEVVADAIARLAAEAGAEADEIVVVNPCGFDRRDVVHAAWDGAAARPLEAVDQHGAVSWAQVGEDGAVVFVASVPSFGVARYRVRPATDPAAWETAALTARPTKGAQFDHVPYLQVDTPSWSVTVRRDSGVIVGLVPRSGTGDLVAFGRAKWATYVDSTRSDLALNVLQVTDELPHHMSSWHLDEVVNERSLLTGAVTEIIEEGPVRAVLRVRHEVRSSTIEQRLVFWRDLPRIDVHTVVDWHEPSGPAHGVPGLKVAFTADVDAPEAWYETPYAAVRRRGNGQEVPALRWAAIDGDGSGIAVLNESKYGYDALGSRLRLTLLRNAYEPDPASDLGRHELTYAIVPTRGDWREASVPEQGIGFNQPLLAARASTTTTSGARGWRPELTLSPGIVCGQLKVAEAEPGARVIRLYDSAGRGGSATVAGLPPGAWVREATVVEDAGARVVVADGRATVRLRPWQVRTLLVGVAPP